MTNCYNIQFTEIDKTCISKKYSQNENEMIHWEIMVSKYLESKNINYLPFRLKDNQLIYDMKNIVSLFDCLQTKNLNLFLNEIFSFVDSFHKIYFYHGNVNLYNLHYDKEKSVFMVSDFSNSRYKNTVPKYKQYLFNNLEVLYNIPKRYHDLFSLYLSIFFFFQRDKNFQKISMYLYDLLNDYIPFDYINLFLSNFYSVTNEKRLVTVP
jgi:RIO-like serine/threonine protein kinase